MPWGSFPECMPTSESILTVSKNEEFGGRGMDETIVFKVAPLGEEGTNPSYV